MASANTQIIPYFPPPSSESTHQFPYEVFLSFRGEDTRCGFTGHLYEALISHGFHTFRDDNELKRGGVIASELQKAIEESKIFVVIFSPNYANSRWYLDELVKISQLDRLIIPIFYNVDPSDMRKQSGTYGKVFLDHQKQANDEKGDKIQDWRSALAKVGDLAGYDLQKYRYETMLIKEIIDVICKELNSKLSLHVSNNMVRMNYHLEKLKSLMEIESNDVRMIGIYGLGGIGKTTISKVVYNNISHLFESSIFLGAVRERSQHYEGRLNLQKELLHGAIKGTKMEIYSLEEGISVIKTRLCSKKLLLILDDVNDSKQLEFLAGELGWFGPSSRIILTTRDQRLLKEHEVHASYEVKCLDYNESSQLFFQHAFKQNIPEKNYVDPSKDMVKYANGLPLALKVLGSSLHDRSVLEWESVLQKLKTKPICEVQNVLKVSFEGLDDTQQETFLDIACFFKGCYESEVIRLVEHAKIDIRVLSEKNLITLLDNNTVEMHDLVQEMGREIVRQEHPQEPGKWSRLWDPDIISLVLKKKTGTNTVQGIFLDMSRSSRDMIFTTKAFRKMKGLRLVKVYWGGGFTNHMEMEYPKLLVDEDFKFPSHDLRYLHWERYPLESLPSNFDGGKLVELNLKHSSIKYLWEGEKHLEKLRVLNLSSSQQLTYMPCFSNIPNLEHLNIESCGRLKKVYPSIDALKNLTSLILRECNMIKKLPRAIQGLVALDTLDLLGCANLRSLPSSICKLKCLKYLDLSLCRRLKTFPEITENMECLMLLHLSESGIEGLPSSIRFINHLYTLTLKRCTSLRSLPSSICKLKFIQELDLSDCLSLESFPEMTEDIECLEDLDLNRTYIYDLISLRLEGCLNLRSLPSSICKLKFLKYLGLSGCSKLESFPEIMEDMEWLEYLELRGAGITELPSSIGNLDHLTRLVLSSCKNLRSLSSNISSLKFLRALYLDGCPNLVTEDMDGVTTSNLWCLSSLEYLDLSKNNMRRIPAAISQLCNLNILNINHCKMLEEIPELPSRLRELYIHDCPTLGTLSNPSTLLWSSLLKWFKKVEPREPMDLREWRMINLGICGIPAGWVQHQEAGIQIRIELPMNWYHDDHFLGFGFVCIQQPGFDGIDIHLDLCFDEQHSYQDSLYLPDSEYLERHGSKSDEVVLLYFPKVAIPDKCFSSQYVLFEANGIFSGYGIHLIYSEDHQRNHNLSLELPDTQDDDEDNHMPMLLNLPENSEDNISASQYLKRRRDDAEHNYQAQEPHPFVIDVGHCGTLKANPTQDDEDNHMPMLLNLHENSSNNRSTSPCLKKKRREA